VVAVASIDAMGTPASNSAIGPQLDLAAPGSMVERIDTPGAAAPSIAPRDLAPIVNATAVDITVPGFDTRTGFGRLDAAAAVREVREEQVIWLDLEGEHARMLASARAGVAAMPEDLESLRRLSLALIERGTGDDDVRAGVALVRRTLEMAPGNAFAHVALARGLVKLGDADGAVAEFRRAMELDPQSPVIRSMADEAAVQLGRPVLP
ncbi:MAG: hypothetical protein ACKOFI_08265, partial [Phycisphaerales bacterium]